jgi:hypothetical protein
MLSETGEGMMTEECGHTRGDHVDCFCKIREKIKLRGSARFHQILAELGELHDKKQKDYGRDADPFANVRASEAFGIPGWVGCAVRANDKMIRIQKAASGGALMNESLEDSLRDLAVYAVIALCLLEEGSEK